MDLRVNLLKKIPKTKFEQPDFEKIGICKYLTAFINYALLKNTLNL
jgi:hypothetical protein